MKWLLFLEECMGCVTCELNSAPKSYKCMQGRRVYTVVLVVYSDKIPLRSLHISVGPATFLFRFRISLMWTEWFLGFDSRPFQFEWAQ